MNDHQYTLLIIIPIMIAKIAVLIVLGALISVSSSHKHILSGLSPHLNRMTTAYKSGDTSYAFSLAMQLYLQTRTLYEQMGFDPDSTSDDIELTDNRDKDLNCDAILKNVQQLIEREDWAEQLQVIYAQLTLLQSKCTNSDFVTGKTVMERNGFDDTCALCTVITRVMENYVVYHRRNITKFIEDEFCSMFDGIVKPTCEAFTHYWGGVIIKALIKKQNPDVICQKRLKMCKNPQCKIVKETKRILLEEDPKEDAAEMKQMIASLNKPHPWEWLIHLFTDHFGDKHLPPFDLDNDTFSDISTFRGYHWRGADCNELNPLIYPGRKTKGKKGQENAENSQDLNGIHLPGVDHDCNGIFGLTPKGKDWEEELCSGYPRYGVAVIGDSAGAHFSIPQKFFNVSLMQKGTFSDLLPRVADELDIPHESAYTGHSQTKYHSHSIYKYLRKHNLCNNNDYQNLGVNGGDSGNTWGNIKALKRDPSNDYPLLMFMELIGNDVCAKSFEGMTKPDEFKRNILKLWNWLDTTAPKGSHLIVLGLADGDQLFEYLHDSMHPLNVTYETVYDFLNCLKISPCWGWLNTDHATRKKTTEHARLLSAVYQQILAEGHTFKNFDVVYYDFPTDQIIKRKMLEGGDPRDMIEKCDGFHPSIEFNSFLADWLWYKINQFHPEWIGEENKNNALIKQIFGFKDLE